MPCIYLMNYWTNPIDITLCQTLLGKKAKSYKIQITLTYKQHDADAALSIYEYIRDKLLKYYNTT